MDYANLKLVIWDLDGTFWNGTLSEGPVEPIEKNCALVKSLTDSGVINSICSKNDEAPVLNRLQEIGMANYFVFPSVNWLPKGQRIKQLLQEMGLRAINTLFIDDNIQNLNEAKFYEPDLNIAEPSVIDELCQFFAQKEKSDPQHIRLQQYKILETKQKAKSQAADNLAFLYDSNTVVELHHDCAAQVDRIVELVQRSNQLNFTKRRDSKEELLSLFSQPDVQTGYVSVSDRFGDYGIVGFFAMKESRLIHFCFSCRTIGQGVEQWVYAHLNYPKLDVVGDVISNVDRSPAPDWINKQSKKENSTRKTNAKIIFKGACDLNITSDYLISDNIVGEFTYVGKKGNNMEMINHSVNYLSLPFLDKRSREKMLSELSFSDEGMFSTHIYDDNIDLILLSTMMEPNLGVYKNKESGEKIAFGENYYPLTDPKNWDLYINNTIFTADNHFTKEWLQWFSTHYEYVGALTPAEILENAKHLLSKLNPKTKLCYFLGSETPFLANMQVNYNDRHLIYRQINDLFRAWAATEERVLLVDFNDYIHSQSDFTNNINHFVRRVYYDAATTINGYIAQITGEQLKRTSWFNMRFWSLVDKVGDTGFYTTKFWAVVRKPYVWMKKQFQKEFQKRTK